jgi:N-methylhydantoinase A/oxoprolinase/acetone carboxylase beta subunit
MIRVGIDVGGTNTDAALLDGFEVIRTIKTPTTQDVTSGVLEALRSLFDGISPKVDAVMIGTTHFTNAIVQRRELSEVAIIRLGAPATLAIPPMTAWSQDLQACIGNQVFFAKGGNEFDGRPISAFDPAEISSIAHQIKASGVTSVAITSVFSPINYDLEEQAASIIAQIIPDAGITLSHTIGRVGFLERENATILNASLQTLGKKIAHAFADALEQAGIDAPFFLTQNDGTLMPAARAEKFPILTVASGPTNSMRGAAFLSKLKEAVVVDIGGTTTDVGALMQGFPRQAGVAVEVGGVRTNFRMPDVYSIGLGGGSLVKGDQIGPQSVGYQLEQQALVFGGQTLTTTDIAVAAGLAQIGDSSKVSTLEPSMVEATINSIQARVLAAVDRVRLTAAPIPVVLVGGGVVLVRGNVGDLETIRPDHFAAANAVGAAIAQVSGELEKVYLFDQISREAALEEATEEAKKRAVAAGAKPESLEVVEIEDVPLSYLPGNATRIRVKVVGDLTSIKRGI